MSFFYELKKIVLGERSQTGHVVYKNARYQEENDLLKKIVFKENKNNDPNLSRFEVAFSSLASRFLAPNLTPAQALVKDEDHQIVGLATEHFSYAAARREGKATFYVTEDTDNWFVTKKRKVTKNAEEIPVYFLNQFRPGFFAILWQAVQRGQLRFDMDSLASVLTSSYTLEEDDLHKGNFGFYLVKKEGKIHVVFFKIDNDLMMADSVMSHCSSRIVSWRHGEHAFDITKLDLIDFPKLCSSQNHYWPTSKAFVAQLIDDKVYSNLDEINAFADLANSEEFQQAKWRHFYKHILISPVIIEQSLAQSCDKEDPSDRAQLALLTHAAIGRQARLRAVLFTIPAFRHFVQNLDKSAMNSLQDEILDGIQEKTDRRGALLDDMVRYQHLCQPHSLGCFVDGDTPMHVAIRLQDYRYHETWQSFGNFAKQPNSKGEKPVDVAVALTKEMQPHWVDDVRQDPFFIIKALLKEGVDKTESYEQLDTNLKTVIKTYRFGTVYINRVNEINSSAMLINLLRDIGEDYRYSLKMKKELSVACMQKFIEGQREIPDFKTILTDIKEALNGKEDKKPAPELQFIRQLRSRLWIIRKIRGLLGGTSTQVELNGLINNELNHLKPSCFSCFSFFSHNTNDSSEFNVTERQNFHLI